MSSLAGHLRACGVPAPEAKARRLAVAVHRHGALHWDDLGLGRRSRPAVERAVRFGPLLSVVGRRIAEDGTTKLLFETTDGHRVEAVLIPNRGNWTACLSSQVGCALGCTFCATGRLGLTRNLTAGEMTESLVHLQADRGVRVTDVVFMGQGEPLHAYDAVMDACVNLADDLGHMLSRRRITVSTSGLAPEMRRYTDEQRPWRLHLSLHSAVQATRERLMPIARRHPLSDVLDALRDHQRRGRRKWVTLQYVALPGINLDDEHVDALGEQLAGLRYILNVIPWNEFSGTDLADAGFRAPSWDEVKDFTTRLRRLGCPVKIRYSAGKREGMGCGQLSAESLDVRPAGGHMTTRPGIFSPTLPRGPGQEVGT